MNATIVFSFVILFACIVVSCGPTSSPPTIVKHSLPYPENKAADISEIAKLGGCTAEDSGFTCPPGSKLYSIGCEVLSNDIRYPGLRPNPIYRCERLEYLPGFKERYNVDWQVIGHIGDFTYDGNQFVLVTEGQNIQRMFAPIESENEALSYAMAFVTYSKPDWFISVFDEYQINYFGGSCGLSISDYPGFRVEGEPQYFTDRIDTAFTKEIGDGYIVHLFTQALSDIDSGCFTGIYSMDMLVKPSGEISTIEPGPILTIGWEDCPGPDEAQCP